MTYLYKNKSVLSGTKETTGFVGSFGEVVTGNKKDYVSVNFRYPFLNYDYDLDLNASITTGDGVKSATNSSGVVSSASVGVAVLQSKDTIRYTPGHTAFADFTASFEGTGTGYAGCTDYLNGFALRVDNNVASFGYIKTGVEKGSSGVDGFDTQSSWNGDIDPNTVDWTKKNIFRIVYGYLGVANPVLQIKLDDWYTLHALRTEGRLTGTHVDDPVFPISIKAVNGMTVRTGSWNGGTIGKPNGVGTRTFGFPNTLLTSGAGPEQGQVTLSGTSVTTLALFRSRDVYKSKANKTKARLLSYDIHIDIPVGAVQGTVIFQVVGVETLSAPSTNYLPIDDDNSVMEYDSNPGTGASVSVLTGKPLVTKHLNYLGSNKGGEGGEIILDADKLGATAYAGDQFAVIAKDLGGNGVTVRFDVEWEELFS